MKKPRPTTVRFALAAIALLLCLAPPSAAQHDSRGRVFWITFMANYGSGGGGERSDMRLYLSSEVPTVARVIYHGTGKEVVVPLPEARTTVEVDIREVFGTGVEQPMWVERSKRAIQVIADDEITCYGVSIRNASADAFMALPDDVLSHTYIVLAYPNGWEDAGRGNARFDCPSQFAVVATEDGTTVDIVPKARLYNRQQAPFRITLDRGEVFNGQAQLDRSQDVSGTEIYSNKPVAVFSGNRRTSIPQFVGRWRDHLVEQMPPLAVWGKEAIITPHYPISSSAYPAVVRIVAAFDDTRWWIDGIEQPVPLDRASSVEIPLSGSMYITADDPILVAQYEHSTASDNGGQWREGDPFMMIVPPTEQFDTAYAFQAVDHWEFLPDDHFVNIVIPTAATGSVRINGFSIDAEWLPAARPGYSYTQVNVTPGSHNIDADSAFGIYVYGFGLANSYGYPGGMLFRTLVHDFQPPGIDQAVACLEATGIAFENQVTDSGIDSIFALPATANVAVTIEPFLGGADTVRYRASLVDPYEDGIVSMKVVDSVGRSMQTVDTIPGFTVAIAGRGTPLLLDTLVTFAGGVDTCLTITIANTGAFPQVIEAIATRPALDRVRVDAPMPLALAPGEQRTVSVCTDAWFEAQSDVAITAVGACIERPLAILPLGGVDTVPPTISGFDASCARGLVVHIEEQAARRTSIRSIAIDTLVNCREVRRGAMPAMSVDVELAAIDPRYDAIYQLRVVDGAGNVAVRRDTIAGFTVALLDVARDTVSYRLDRDIRIDAIVPGIDRCDSVTVTNFGSRTITLSSVHFGSNRGLSIPPSQIPFVIAPHTERRLAVCVDGATGPVHDTLFVSDGCGRYDAVAIRGMVATMAASDRCNNAIAIRTVGAARRTFLSTPFPNPSHGATASVDIGLESDTRVAIELLDASGAPVAVIMRDNPMRAGVHRVEFDIAALGSGTYYCRLRTDAGILVVEKLVLAR